VSLPLRVSGLRGIPHRTLAVDPREPTSILSWPSPHLRSVTCQRPPCASPSKLGEATAPFVRLDPLRHIRYHVASHVGFTSPDLPARSVSHRLAPYTPRLHPSGLVSCRRHPWGCTLQSFSLPSSRTPLDATCPLDVTASRPMRFLPANCPSATRLGGWCSTQSKRPKPLRKEISAPCNVSPTKTPPKECRSMGSRYV